MTEPSCLHTTRVKVMEVRQGTSMARTMYAERCQLCSTVFLFTKDSMTARYPDGSYEMSAHGGERADGGHASDMVNALLNGMRF